MLELIDAWEVMPRQEDMGRKVTGSNPSAGKIYFYLEIFDKVRFCNHLAMVFVQ